MMLAQESGATAGEGLVQQMDIGNQASLHQSPVGKLVAARAANLISEELDGPVQDPVVVRLDDPVPVSIHNLN